MPACFAQKSLPSLEFQNSQHDCALIGATPFGSETCLQIFASVLCARRNPELSSWQIRFGQIGATPFGSVRPVFKFLHPSCVPGTRMQSRLSSCPDNLNISRRILTGGVRYGRVGSSGALRASRDRRRTVSIYFSMRLPFPWQTGAACLGYNLAGITIS